MFWSSVFQSCVSVDHYNCTRSIVTPNKSQTHVLSNSAEQKKGRLSSQMVEGRILTSVAGQSENSRCHTLRKMAPFHGVLHPHKSTPQKHLDQLSHFCSESATHASHHVWTPSSHMACRLATHCTTRNLSSHTTCSPTLLLHTSTTTTVLRHLAWEYLGELVPEK